MENLLAGKTVLTTSEAEYELLDSGDGQKLERFGLVVLARPDPQALWPKRLSVETWQKAAGFFGQVGGNSGHGAGGTSSWHFKPGVPKQWQISFAGLQFLIRPSAFKHVGLFPEQRGNWEWMAEKISAAKNGGENGGRKELSVLNLFGYTGGATLAVAHATVAAGITADICHLDGSKAAIGSARENAALSGLATAPIRWILDDAATFVRREIKRGRHYDAIILDPPAFGRGPQGQIWKIEDDFLGLLELCKQALSKQPLFFLVNGYASGYSAIGYYNALVSLFEKGFGSSAQIEAGELAIAESTARQGGRLLPAGIFARWSAK